MGKDYTETEKYTIYNDYLKQYKRKKEHDEDAALLLYQRYIVWRPNNLSVVGVAAVNDEDPEVTTKYNALPSILKDTTWNLGMNLESAPAIQQAPAQVARTQIDHLERVW